MRLLTTHEARHAGPAPQAQYYSLGLPAWAAPTTGPSASGSGSARKPDLAQRVLHHMRSHPTGAER
jgi:hypothetical protein